METVLVEILVGLPGSGKTHYATQYGVNPACLFEHSGETVRYISIDDAQKGYGYTYQNLADIIRDHNFKYCINIRNDRYAKNWNHWVIDGLFLTHKSQHDIVDVLNKVTSHNDVKLQIRFVYFREDREACMFNDAMRNRNKLANITIKNATYEKPDIESLQNEYKNIEFELVEKDVHRMNVYEASFLTRGSAYYKGELRSDTWCLGGTWGNYKGECGNVGADEQPIEFEEFDNLLMEVCPEITLLQYKKLYKATVSIETEEECDYYGGSTENAYYKCNLKDLYNMMIEMGLISENE